MASQLEQQALESIKDGLNIPAWLLTNTEMSWGVKVVSAFLLEKARVSDNEDLMETTVYVPANQEVCYARALGITTKMLRSIFATIGGKKFIAPSRRRLTEINILRTNRNSSKTDDLFIPRWVLEQPEFDMDEKVVYSYLLTRLRQFQGSEEHLAETIRENDSFYAQINGKSLSRMFGCSQKMLLSILHALEHKKFITDLAQNAKYEGIFHCWVLVKG